MPPPADLPSFEEIKRVVGFNQYYQEEEKYKISVNSEELTESGVLAYKISH